MKNNKIIKFIIKNKFILLLLLIHILGILFFYGIIDILNDELIYDYDYPYHLYQSYEAKHYYEEGRSWGYNPFLTAGYPSGVYLDNHLFQLLCVVFPFESQIILIKIWLILILFLLPILIYFSSINFGFSKKIAIISFLILLIYLYNSHFINSVIQFGMFNFVFGSILSLFYLSLFYRYFIRKERKIIIFLFITLPFFVLVHSSILLVFFIPFFLMYFLNFNKLSFKNNFLIIFVIFLSLSIFLFWIGVPFLTQIKPYLGDTDQYFQIKNLKEFLSDFYYNSFGVNKGSQYIKTIIIFFGLSGIFSWFRRNKLFYVFLPVFLLLFIIIYFHNIIRPLNFISQIQPYKFIIPLVFFSIIPASYFINKLIKKIKFYKFYHPIKILYFVFILFLLFQIINIQLNHQTKQTLHTYPPKDYVELVNWINKNTNNKERILFETAIPVKDLFEFPSFLPGIISLDTNREFLFGPHNDPFLKHNFPSLTSNDMFRNNWDDLSNKKLINYLDLYNVGWIIAKSENSKKNLYKRYKQGVFIDFIKIDDFQIYKTNITLGFIIGGTGDIELDFNKIKIKNLEIKNKDIILKYHWHPTLKEKSGLKLEPVYILDMPIPFIKILNVSDSKLEIYNSYNE